MADKPKPMPEGWLQVEERAHASSIAAIPSDAEVACADREAGWGVAECDKIRRHAIADFYGNAPKVIYKLLAHATAADRRIADLEKALRMALHHVKELEEAWMTGALSERDGKGGMRSNRNADVRVAIRAALGGGTEEGEC